MTQTGRGDERDQGSQGHVYLIDEDREVRSHVGALLRLLGYDVRTFGDAAAFLDSLAIEYPAVIVLDMRLPGMRGLEVQQRLAAIGSLAMIVYLSADSERQDIVDAMKAGAADFLWKPVSRDRLAEAVGSAMWRSRLAARQFMQQARLRDGLGQLSQREREVYDLMVNGWQNRQIAARLGIRADTVKKHRAVICEKFLVEDTAGLIELSRRQGDDRASLPR